jgi:hypothetical protein
MSDTARKGSRGRSRGSGAHGQWRRGRRALVGATVVGILVAGCTGGDDDDSSPRGNVNFSTADAASAAQRLADTEFTPSTLSKADQLKELEWFTKAAEPYRGLQINVVSETITTHEYESKTLAKAFTELTGIQVKHDLIQEGDVIEPEHLRRLRQRLGPHRHALARRLRLPGLGLHRR